MLKPNPLSISALLLSIVFLTSCGGGGGGGAENSATSPDLSSPTTPQTNDTTISGRVIDGYLANAKVCIDKNDNLLCDADEDSAFTDANGAYTLSVNYDPAPYTLIAEAIPGETEDLDRGEVTKAYTLAAPAFVKEGQTENNITVYTTVAAINLYESPSLPRTHDTLNAIEAVIELTTGLVDPMGVDYIAENDAGAQKAAENFVTILQEIQEPLIVSAQEALAETGVEAATEVAAEAISSAVTTAKEMTLFSNDLDPRVDTVSEETVESISSTNTDTVANVVAAAINGKGEVKTIEEIGEKGVVIISEKRFPRNINGVCTKSAETTWRIEFATAIDGVFNLLERFHSGNSWEPACDESISDQEDTYVLSESGYVPERDFGQDYSFVDNCILANLTPDSSIKERFCLEELDLSNQIAKNTFPKACNDDCSGEAFPEGASGYNVRFSRTADKVEIYKSTHTSTVGDFNCTSLRSCINQLTGARTSENKIDTINVGYPRNGCANKTIVSNFPQTCETRIHFISFDEETSKGTVSWHDPITPRPPAFFPVQPPATFEIKTIFGRDVAVLSREHAIYRATQDSDDYFNQMLFTYVDEEEGNSIGLPVGFYRGEFESGENETFYQLNRPDQKLFMNKEALPLVLQSWEKPSFPDL
ncbi:MAG: carboxypeptidase-like regulatory domain-containing protein [Candidatus Azotimanducaceae bacterium]|uniref:Carboxypeptidase regulatory-like domain-containing protein n=1 Tax=OM182 bacterium TaxID=2510334 RepID=A0A520RY95_9GAMM|nr:MAG: carboxypeptidase regulatory-like domain-containing protein [OM182 bacterium]